MDETLDKWNSSINHRKLNRTKLLAIDCDVKRKFVFMWHLCSWFLFLAYYEKGEGFIIEGFIIDGTY